MEDHLRGAKLLHQGAEAKLYSTRFLGRQTIVKERFSKKYRHPALDELLTKDRTKTEAKYMMKCRYIGIHTPAIYYVDEIKNSIYMEHITDGITVRQRIDELQHQDNSEAELNNVAVVVGHMLGKMHANNIIHGDLTTSNMLLRIRASTEAKNITLIDFGLSYTSATPEDKGVDLYVLERAILSTHPNSEEFIQTLFKCYAETNSEALQVMKRLDEIRMRGRKRTMVG